MGRECHVRSFSQVDLNGKIELNILRLELPKANELVKNTAIKYQ